MNKKRLLKLADLLEADAANKKGIKFDLDCVGQASDWDCDFDPSKGDVYTPGVDCGTAGCAMGLAAISGAFKGPGLSYEVYGQAIEITLDGEMMPYDRAAQDFFDISLAEANFLFSPSHYPIGAIITGARGERRVAKRIRDFVAGKVASLRAD